MENVYPTASWAAACIIIAIQRPETTTKSLLVLYSSIFGTQAIVLINGTSRLKAHDAPTILVIFTALTSVTIILRMPMRHPLLPSGQISPAFDPPTSQLRSPEDNFTLWQFMTVSWMAPLISLGNARQLNDEDVWSLSYEFQHRTLHDKFRSLQGSVLGRLLEANGIDLFIISILSILELTASMMLFLLMKSSC
jgi:hypothetical protein